MPRTPVRPRGSFVAVTTARKGKLHKNHLAHPDVGLSAELKRSQEEPVTVMLRPLRIVPIEQVHDYKAVNVQGQYLEGESDVS
jgi:hypothetical protein